jgi:hypothetical protein
MSQLPSAPGAVSGPTPLPREEQTRLFQQKFQEYLNQVKSQPAIFRLTVCRERTNPQQQQRQ